MTQVNLLPPEVLRTQRYRRVTSAIFVAGGIVLACIVAFYLLQTNELSGVNDEIEVQGATNASIQASIAEKQKFADLQAEAQKEQALLASAYAGEVSFSSMLMDVSRVIPSEAYFDNLSLQAGDPAAEVATAEQAGAVIGTITASGQALTVDTLSAFLTRLEQVEGWVNPWMSTISKNQDAGSYDFAMSVDLTDQVITSRGGGAGDAPE